MYIPLMSGLFDTSFGILKVCLDKDRRRNGRFHFLAMNISPETGDLSNVIRFD
jgi:hypothetical protein